MAIIFENIETGEIVKVDIESGGRFFEAKLAALVNSSDMSPNADRGQDFGYRLHPEQKAKIDEWKEDSSVIEKVSNYTKVQVDGLTDRDFLAYYAYQEDMGKAPVKINSNKRKEAEAEYNKRVAAAKAGEGNSTPPTKAEMIEQAKSDGLEIEVTQKNTVAEIKKAIEEARQNSDKE